jgi:hypothetical protein
MLADAIRNGGAAGGIVSPGSGKAAPALLISADSTDGADASTSVCTGSGALADAVRTAGRI